MNVLVTGANGYIGNSLVYTLKKQYNVIQIQHSIEFNVEIALKQKIFYMDLLNNEHIKLFLKEINNIDIVIHTASVMASSFNINDIQILYDNIKIYEHLIYIADQVKPKKVINFSSIAVYPNIDGEYSESSIIKPSSNNDAYYGLSKFCGENLLDYKLNKLSIKIVHLRISQVFSNDLRDDRTYMVMKKELEETNKITVYGNGERISNFIHKNLLIKYVIFFIKNEYYGVFNIGDKNISYKELAYSIIKQYGNKNSKIIFIEDGSKSKFYLNLNKLNSIGCPNE